MKTKNRRPAGEDSLRQKCETDKDKIDDRPRSAAVHLFHLPHYRGATLSRVTKTIQGAIRPEFRPKLRFVFKLNFVQLFLEEEGVF